MFLMQLVSPCSEQGTCFGTVTMGEVQGSCVRWAIGLMAGLGVDLGEQKADGSSTFGPSCPERDGCG